MSKGKLLNGVRIIGLVTKASTAEIFHPQSVSLNSDGSLQDPLPPVDTVAAWHCYALLCPPVPVILPLKIGKENLKCHSFSMTSSRSRPLRLANLERLALRLRFQDT